MNQQKFVVVDSLTGRSHEEHRIYSVSYFMSWQLVRLSLDFTIDGYRGTLAKLRVYYDKAADTQERQYRLFRIRNLLNAIPFGQTTLSGIRSFNDERKPMILNERSYYTLEKEKIGYPTYWDWNWTREDIEQYSFEVRDPVFRDIMYRAHRPEPKTELMFYLDLLENTEWKP